MTKDKYFHALLNSATLVVNYDELLSVFQESDSNSDPFVFAAYEFSKRCKTIVHIERAHTFMKELAHSVLVFNLCEENLAASLLDDFSEVCTDLQRQYLLIKC